MHGIAKNTQATVLNDSVLTLEMGDTLVNPLDLWRRKKIIKTLESIINWIRIVGVSWDFLQLLTSLTLLGTSQLDGGAEAGSLLPWLMSASSRSGSRHPRGLERLSDLLTVK